MRLLHFTSLSRLIEDILPQKKLYMGLFSNTNDPYENQLFQFDPKNWTYPDNDIHNYFTLKTQLNQIVREKARMICFSIDEAPSWISVYGYRSSSMWAHYGDKHKGVCVVLDRNKFVKENRKCIDFLGKVKYTNELRRPEINLSSINAITEKTVQNVIRELKHAIFFSKLKDWRYENEYRVVNYNNSSVEFCSIKDSLIEIILGTRVNDNYLPTILRMVSKKATIRKAVFHNKFILKECINGYIQY